MPIWDQYVYSTLSEKRGFPYDELVVEKEGLGCNFTELNSTLKDLEQQVQSLATKIDLGNTFFMAIPSLIVAPFWGPWTDKTGRRKPALMAPAIGTLLQTILVLMIMYFEWPLYVLFVGSAISGFSGFLTTLMLASMSYIADTTEKTGVAFRIGKKNDFYYSETFHGSTVFCREKPTYLLPLCLLACWAEKACT